MPDAFIAVQLRAEQVAACGCEAKDFCQAMETVHCSASIA